MYTCMYMLYTCKYVYACVHRIQCGIQYSQQVHWFGTVIVAFFIFFAFTFFSSIISKFSKIHLVSIQQKVKVSLVFMREYRNAALLPGCSKGARVKPPRGQHCLLLSGAICLLNGALLSGPRSRLLMQDCVQLCRLCRLRDAHERDEWDWSQAGITCLFLHFLYSFSNHSPGSWYICYICMLNEWMTAWMSQWNTAERTVLYPAPPLTLPYMLMGVKYNSMEGNALKVKSSNSFLGIYLRDVVVHGWSDICIKLFYCRFVCNSKNWKQSKCLSMGDYI